MIQLGKVLESGNLDKLKPADETAKSKAGKIAQGLPEVRIVLLLLGSAIRKQKYKEFFARIPVNQ